MIQFLTQCPMNPFQLHLLYTLTYPFQKRALWLSNLPGVHTQFRSAEITNLSATVVVGAEKAVSEFLAF